MTEAEHVPTLAGVRDAKISLVEVAATPVPESVPPCDIYLVLAHRKGLDGYGEWSIRSKDWRTEEAARKSIRNLAVQWQHVHIVRVRIP